PLPFGVLSPRLEQAKQRARARGEVVSIAFRRSVPPAHYRLVQKRWLRQLSLHCLSAFCPPGSRGAGKDHEAESESPLPFGALPPRLKLGGYEDSWTAMHRLHCLSAFSPATVSTSRSEEHPSELQSL